jgi:Domain of unknown function (DUF4349)
MSVIDEERLRHELSAAADALTVSPGALDAVIAATKIPASPGARSRLAASLRAHPRHRRVLVAAAMVAAVAAITVPLVNAQGPRAPLVTAHGEKALGGALAGRPRTATSEQTVNTSLSPYYSPTSSTAAPATRIESSGRVDLTVARGQVAAAMARLTQLATVAGGSVADSQLRSATRANGGVVSGVIVLDVPQARFAHVVSRVEGVGHATSVSTSSVDVTGQYVDLSARITSLKASRRQYLAIMTRATTIGDILAVQAQLNTLQSHIEQLQGQLNLLGHQTAFGNLTVNLSERGHHTSAPHRGNGVARAFSSAVRGFVAGVEWLIRASGPALFALLCLGALWLLARQVWRALRRRAL